jgi:hypothetical protein
MLAFDVNHLNNQNYIQHIKCLKLLELYDRTTLL